MALISDDDRKQLEEEFAKIKDKVRIHFFSSKDAAKCMLCDQTREVLTEVAAISKSVELVEHDDESDKDAIANFNVDKLPAIVFTKEDDKDIGVRIYGIPAGSEFMTLIGAIMDVGGAEIDVPDWVLEKVKEIDKPVHLQVFVTPT